MLTRAPQQARVTHTCRGKHSLDRHTHAHTCRRKHSLDRHTHAHTCRRKHSLDHHTHARTHAHTHTSADVHTQFADGKVYIHWTTIHTHTHAYMHTHVHFCRRAHTRTHLQGKTATGPTHTHTCRGKVNIHWTTHAHARTHTHFCRRAHTHAHTCRGKRFAPPPPPFRTRSPMHTPTISTTPNLYSHLCPALANHPPTHTFLTHAHPHHPRTSPRRLTVAVGVVDALGVEEREAGPLPHGRLVQRVVSDQHRLPTYGPVLRGNTQGSEGLLQGKDTPEATHDCRQVIQLQVPSHALTAVLSQRHLHLSKPQGRD